MNNWSSWERDANPSVQVSSRVWWKWFLVRVSPVGGANPDENYVLLRYAYHEGQRSFPERDGMVCSVKVDGFHYQTRKNLIDRINAVTDSNVAYRLDFKVMDSLRFMDAGLAARRARQQGLQRLNTAAKSLPEGEDVDLLVLHERGFVRARGTGQTIEKIHGEIENLLRRPLNVIIKPGTYFVSSGGHQNMVTRSEHRLVLSPGQRKQVAVEASCINAGLPIPGKGDHFDGVRRVPDNLVRFLEGARNAHPMAVQAGVWALTDGYSGRQVQSRLVAVDQNGNRRQAVSDGNIAEAKRILDGLGIRHSL